MENSGKEQKEMGVVLTFRIFIVLDGKHGQKKLEHESNVSRQLLMIIVQTPTLYMNQTPTLNAGISQYLVGKCNTPTFQTVICSKCTNCITTKIPEYRIDLM